MMNTLKIKRIVVAGGIALSMVSALTGCMENAFNVKGKVKKQLSEKYREEFVITDIGNRFNTGTATVVCHPESNESLRFTVIYDFSTGEMKEDYIDKKLLNEFDTEVAEKFGSAGYDCTAISEFWGHSENAAEDITFSEYVKQEEVKRLYTEIALNLDKISDSSDISAVLNVLSEISEKYYGKEIVTGLHFVPASSYAACSEEMSEKRSVNDNWFEKFGDVISTAAVVKGKSVDKSADDIFSLIKG